MVSFRTVRDQLIQVLHLKESPQRTAIAFAIGVFIAFAPHYGFHTISVVFFAWALRLNYLAMFLGAFLNNPWTIAPILGLTLYTGFTFYGTAPATELNLSHIHLDNVLELLAPYLFPFILGGCLLGLLGAILAYPVMLFLILRYRSSKTR